MAMDPLDAFIDRLGSVNDFFIEIPLHGMFSFQFDLLTKLVKNSPLHKDLVISLLATRLPEITARIDEILEKSKELFELSQKNHKQTLIEFNHLLEVVSRTENLSKKQRSVISKLQKDLNQEQQWKGRISWFESFYKECFTQNSNSVKEIKEPKL